MGRAEGRPGRSCVVISTAKYLHSSSTGRAGPTFNNVRRRSRGRKRIYTGNENGYVAALEIGDCLKADVAIFSNDCRSNLRERCVGETCLQVRPANMESRRWPKKRTVPVRADRQLAYSGLFAPD
jgi:hypothetical protein